MNNLYNYTFNKLIDEFIENGFSKLDAKRVYPWIYNKSVTSIDEMTDLPKHTRDILKQYFGLFDLQCEQLQRSSDGTIKALLRLSDGETIENVLINDNDRKTLCMSTQVGCKMACKFCNTGTQRFVRNLSCAELICQYMYWRKVLEHDGSKITNIVIMGMGEPFMNIENLSDFLEIMLDKNGINMSRHRITVSTSGILDNLLEFGKRFKVELAVSLHAPNNHIRSQIMPINKKYSIEQLISAVKDYPKVSNTDYVTFEYLMLRDINDSVEHAKELCELVKRVKCKINLIMYNEWPGGIFSRSTEDKTLAFQNIIKNRGIMCTIRKSKGTDILAACGQLKSTNTKL